MMKIKNAVRALSVFVLGAGTVSALLSGPDAEAQNGGRPRVVATGAPSATATTSATPVRTPSGTPSATPSRTPRPERTPRPVGTACPTPGPRPTSRPRPTPSPRPTPVPGGRDIAILSGALGRALTSAEQSAITRAVQTRDAALQAAHVALEAEIARIVSVSTDVLRASVQAYLRTHPEAHHQSIAAVLAGTLGRALTEAEASALRGAVARRDAAATAAVDAFRTSVAGTLSLSPEELDARVAAFLGSNSGPGGGSGNHRPGGSGGGRER